MKIARKVILDLAVTLDGFIEGPNGEIDWCIMEPEMNFTAFLKQIDTILYGRKSYELWRSYPILEGATEEDLEMQRLIEAKEKFVFSRTQKSDDKATFINTNISEEVAKMKGKAGGDLWLYGGARLITTFINLDLVDEYRLSVHPVILGAGKPLFSDIVGRVQLELVSSKTFPSGVVQLIYKKN